MNLNIRLLKRIGTHILFWAIYFLIALFIYSFIFKNNISFIISSTIKIFPFILITTYTMLYVIIPEFLNKNKLALFIISFFTLPAIISLIYRTIRILLFRYEHPDYTEPIAFFSGSLLIFTFENLLVMSVASIIKIIKKWYYSEHKRLLLEKRNLESKLEIIQYQINPHFLFNVLNNLYSLAIENNDNITANGIDKLSSLMRYNIYTNKNNKVPLKEEVEYIKNYIQLQKIRFYDKDKINIEFNIKGNINSIFIEPFILIMFIENAFKHGINSIQIIEIIINLEISVNHIYFQISNNKNNLKNEVNSGIGLKNVKQRLEYFYPSKHKLDIIDNDEKYIVKLEINTK